MLKITDGNDSGKEVTSESSDYQPIGEINIPKVESTMNPLKVLGSSGEIKEIFKAMSESVTNISGNYTTLINASQQLANSMGIGQARASQLQLSVAATVPELEKLGLTATESFKAMKDAPVALGTNTTIAKETIIELGATTKFTGLEVGALAKTFKDVGFELGKVGETMADVANYAKSVGANVLEVTKLVSGQLKNLNLFNFENGVQGLSKMAASATMLGYDMTKVMAQAEKLLKPENAIEFSAALQRLGVTSTELLDPLSAMDLAMNNPERLATEMEKVAQQFVQLKADGSGFEIMPGAKLQLREVASELGYTAEEFASMAVRGADLDMKLKQIRFPAFAASEEDRMLIANMSQMKGGRAVVQIEQDDKLEEVAVEDLTAEQLKILQKEQANQNKTAEELAIDQLNVLQEIEANTKGGIRAAQLGVASVGPLRRYMETISETRSTLVKNTVGQFDSETIKGAIEVPLKALETSLVNFIQNPSLESLVSGFKDFDLTTKTLKESIGDLVSGVDKTVSNIGTDLQKKLSEIYGPVAEGAGVKFSENLVGEMKPKDITTEIGSASSTITKNSNVNFGGEIGIKYSSDGSMTNEQLAELIKKGELSQALIEKIKNDVNVQKALSEVGTYDNMNE